MKTRLERERPFWAREFARAQTIPELRRVLYTLVVEYGNENDSFAQISGAFAERWHELLGAQEQSDQPLGSPFP